MLAEELLPLYELAYQAPAECFCALAIAFLRRHVSFDAAFWCNAQADISTAEVVPNALHIEHLDTSFLMAWAREVETDPVLHRCYANHGEVQRIDVDITYAKLGSSRRLLRQVNINSYECTLLDGFSPGEIQFLSLYHEQREWCSDEEKRHVEALLPHMRLAWKMNHALEANSVACGGASTEAGTSWCVAEAATGAVIRAQRAFEQAMAADFAGPRQAGCLAASIMREVGVRTRGRIKTMENLYEFRVVGAHLFIAARGCRAHGRLTPRQHQVARLYASGLSHKEVAASLGIAPSTVRNLVAAVFDQLGVGSRMDLLRALEQRVSRVTVGDRS